MLREGAGWIRPSPVKIALFDTDLKWARQIADTRNRHRGYRYSRNEWNRGLLKDPVYDGVLGEIAMVAWLNGTVGVRPLLTVDETLYRYGDGGKDIVVYGLSIDTKGETRNRPFSLVRRVTDRKRLAPLAADVYAFMTTEDPYGILFQGWLARSELRQKAVQRPARRGKHFNLEVEKRFLESPRQLQELIELKRETISC
jgi:hypothetical protein